ncbi:type II toxin-antitoxin system VapC family toxin [bacterium]|nr:type II toxin-antitoxin system VapC family toxin [bacterium]
MDLIVDTTVLIDLWRSKGRLKIRAEENLSLGLPWVGKAEFLRGAVLAGHAPQVVQSMLARFEVIWPGEKTLALYAQTWALLRRGGKTLGVHDLWIAVCGLEHGKPVWTRNVNEFRKVPDLKVVE